MGFAEPGKTLLSNLDSQNMNDTVRTKIMNQRNNKPKQIVLEEILERRNRLYLN